MKIRNFLALILSILMIVTMLPTNIFAAPLAVTVGDTITESDEQEREDNLATAELASQNQILEISLSDGVMNISGFNNLDYSDIVHLYVLLPGQENPKKTVSFQYVTTDTTVFEYYYGLFKENGIYKFYLTNEENEIVSNVFTFDFT